MLIGILCLLQKPVKWILKMLLHTLAGGGILLILNSLGSFSGMFIAVNFLTTAICGLLGIPGLCMLIALEHFV